MYITLVKIKCVLFGLELGNSNYNSYAKTTVGNWQIYFVGKTKYWMLATLPVPSIYFPNHAAKKIGSIGEVGMMDFGLRE